MLSNKFLRVVLCLLTSTLGTSASDASRRDGLPDGAVARFGAQRFRHGAPVTAIASAISGKMIVSVGGGVIRTWNSNDGRQTWAVRQAPVDSLLFLQEQSVSMAVANRSNRLVTTSIDGIAVYDLVSHELLATHSVDRVGGVSVSDSGELLAASQIAPRAVHLWDSSTGSHVEIQGLESPASALALSPDGRLLAVITRSNGALVYSTHDRTEPRRLAGAAEWSGAIAFSPDGCLLAAGAGGWGGFLCRPGSPDRQSPPIKVWDAKSGESRGTLGMWMGGPAAIAFSPNGKWLAAVGLLDPLTVWEVSSGREIMVARSALAQSAVSFLPDGATLACGSQDGTVTLWDANTGTCLSRDKEPAGRIAAIEFSPVEDRLACVAGDDATYVWHLSDPGTATVFSSAGSRAACFSNDGRDLVTVGDSWAIWPIARERARRTTVASYLPFSTCRVLSDGGKVCASIERQKIVVRHATGKTHEWPVAATGDMTPVGLSLSPDAHWVAVRSTGVPARRDGKTVVTIHSADAGTQIHTWPADLIVSAPVFSPDGGQLAWSDHGRIRIVATGTERTSGDNLRKTEQSLDATNLRVGRHMPVFSADCRMIAIGEETGRAVVFELMSGLVRYRTPLGHDGEVTSAAFDVTGHLLATGGSDSTVLVWDLSSIERPVAQASARISSDVARAWDELACIDAARAYSAEWTLIKDSKSATSFLKSKLRPAVPVSADRLRLLIDDLNSDSYPVRSQAAKELEVAAERARPALRQLLKASGTADSKRWAVELLERLDSGVQPQVWRELRAIEVLEHICSPEATNLLNALATGPPEAQKTGEAKAALQRLGRRRGPPGSR